MHSQLTDRIPRFRCPVAMTDEQRERSVEDRDRREREDLERAMEEAARSAVRRAGVCGFVDRELGGELWDAMASGRRGWYLWSEGPGTGKTSAAMGAVERAVHEGRTARILTEATMLGELRELALEGSESEAADIRRMQRIDLLVIDDMGKANVSDKMFSRILEVVDRRTREGLPLVVTANYSLPDLGRKLSRSVDVVDVRAMLSRLSTLEPMEMGGADMRPASRSMSGSVG